MRFTERELTAALTGAAKSVWPPRTSTVRKGRRSVDEAWQSLTSTAGSSCSTGSATRCCRCSSALPDVEVEAGTRPTFTAAQVTSTVESTIGDDVGRVRRAVLVKTRVALVNIALSHVPVRQDPDALIVPDHL